MTDGVPARSCGDAHHLGTVPALAALLVLNLLDWTLTVDALALGIATEANPVGRWMLAQGTGQSLAWKMGVIAAACLALYLLREHRSARCGTLVCVGAYLAVVLYQCAARVVVL